MYTHLHLSIILNDISKYLFNLLFLSLHLRVLEDANAHICAQNVLDNFSASVHCKYHTPFDTLLTSVHITAVQSFMISKITTTKKRLMPKQDSNITALNSELHVDKIRTRRFRWNQSNQVVKKWDETCDSRQQNTISPLRTHYGITKGSQEQNGLENPAVSADFECHNCFLRCSTHVHAAKSFMKIWKIAAEWSNNQKNNQKIHTVLAQHTASKALPHLPKPHSTLIIWSDLAFMLVLKCV